MTAFGGPSLPLAQRTAAALVDLIREAILDGRLKPDEELKEERLARDLGTSRTPVREALIRLKTEGLIDESAGRPARVRVLDAASLADIYELRGVLEGYAARRAAERITDEGLAQLRAAAERLENLDRETAQVSEMMADVVAFHEEIARAAGSERLLGFILRTVQLPLVYDSQHWRDADTKASMDRHRRLLIRAFEAHDPDRAELQMRQYILEARDILLPPSGERPTG